MTEVVQVEMKICVKICCDKLFNKISPRIPLRNEVCRFPSGIAGIVT